MIDHIPAPFRAPSRVLMGPGPSDVSPAVLSALGGPTLGHLDPAFLGMPDESRAMLRAVLATENELTLPMSGTGSLGMETCIANLVEPGDRVLVCVNGVFGTRMSDVARRVGGIVTESQSPWGQAIDVDQARRDAQGRAFKLVCMVHAETSTGALSETAPLRALADELGALLLVDAVTSVGGVPVAMDAHRIDALYSGTQKCLSCPPGLSPVSLSARARELLFARKTSTPSWYGDLSLITRYWGSERAYHHTAPINMLMALHEALRLVLMEGLEARYARHELHGTALRSGLLAMGLTLPVPPAARMPQLTLVQVPPGVDEARVRAHLLREHGLEIGAGLGTFKGKAFRIGLMGESATRRNVTLCLSALFGALQREGFAVREHPLAAADEAYAGA